MAGVSQQQQRAFSDSTFTILVCLPVNQVRILDSACTAFMHGIAVCSCNDETCQVLERALWLTKEAFLLPKGC